jgi:hypothetical protein
MDILIGFDQTTGEFLTREATAAESAAINAG